jgi:hypothetical protein
MLLGRRGGVVGAEPAKRRPWWRPVTTGLPIRMAAGLVALVVAVGAVALLRRPPPRPDGLVVLYGDSLSVEAAPAFVDELARTTDAEVIVRAVPAEAPCDANDDMQNDLALRPTVVVIQFVGNGATACMLDPDGRRLEGRALVDRTAEDVGAATEMFATRGTRVVLVGGPDVPGLPENPGLGVSEAYNELVNEWAGRDLGRVRYADAAAAVSGPAHSFTEALPCRDDEGEAEGCADGRVVVRNDDRVHFCPQAVDGLACPVPSPGARRFGLEMARVTRMALGGY